MRYTLRQLEIFLSIAKNTNTSRAALEMNLSQSAVSAALHALERGHNVRLFDRLGKKLVLNEVGKTLRDEAESLLAHAQDFDSRIRGHEEFGHLKVGASFTIANHLAVNYLALYLSGFPKAKVEFAVGNSPDIVSKVLNYEVDIGMIEAEVRHAELELTPWMEDELIVFCSPDHPLATKTRITDKDLCAAKWILREPESGARQTFDQAFSSLESALEVYLEFKHNEAIKRAVENGLGIGCLSQAVLTRDFKNKSLIPIKLPRKYRMKRSFNFVLPKSRYRKRAIERWMSQCKA